jgi:integrase
VRERLNEVALERDLRPSTRIAYQRCLAQLGILDEPVSAVTKEQVEDAAWRLLNPNTRRNALIAARSVLGFKLRIGRAVPRRYDLPDEDSLRLALMTTPYEVRGLLAMYTGVRLGEAAAITRDSINGRHLRIDRQVQTLRITGQPTVTKIVVPKTAEADVWCPPWLLERVAGVTEWQKPDPIREGIKRAFQRVGLDGMCFHGLRHWHASTALDRGAPIALVSRQLRHSDISTTLRTYHDTRTGDMEKFFA